MSSVVLKIVDQDLGKPRSLPFELRLASERISVRELIARRVQDEIELLKLQSKKNHDAHDNVRSFLIGFEPSSVEEQLNSPQKQTTGKQLDEDEEVRAAIEAFERRRFIILLDDRQIENLDEELSLMPASEVVFYRLVPLIGG